MLSVTMSLGHLKVSVLELGNILQCRGNARLRVKVSGSSECTWTYGIRGLGSNESVWGSTVAHAIVNFIGARFLEVAIRINEVR